MKALSSLFVTGFLALAAVGAANGTPGPTTRPLANTTMPAMPAQAARTTPQPASAVVTPTTLPATRLSAPLPVTAGHSRLRFYTTVNGQPVDMCVVVSSSKKIAETPGRVPVLFFLGGLGDRGSDGNGVFRNGPPAEMMRRSYLNDSLPMLVVSPQSPAKMRWEDPGMDVAMAQLVDILSRDPRVDPDRMYLSGFSSGGKGAWQVATLAAKYFAAIAPIAAKVYSPETCVPAIKDLPVWMIVGDKDGLFTDGSRTMETELRKAGCNVILSELPGVAHSSWLTIYPKPEFYQWFLAYTRGKPPAKIYTPEELTAIARAPVFDPVMAEVNKEFSTFAPYWQLSNCSDTGEPGLRADVNGRQNVFAVRPLNAKVNCVLETTWTIPADRHAKLSIVAGRDLPGDWKLIVDVGDRQELTIFIDRTTAPNGWYETSLDLGEWTGRDVHIDVYAAPGTTTPTQAYFAKLAVETQ